MVVLILLLVLGIFFIALDKPVDGLRYLGIPLIAIFIILLCIVFISLPLSMGTVSDLENFYARNQSIYSKAVVAYPDAATISTSDATTTTVKISWDYTQDVLRYNSELQWYKNYQNHWFLNVFITSVPDSLKFIQLQKE